MIGRTLSHYRIEQSLGAGGMGVVYRARDLHLDRDVALKVLPPDLLRDDGARQRFRREALALSRLHHAHVNVVHDFDVEHEIQFLVMELVPGVTLAELLQPGPLPEPQVLQLGLQIAGALEAAHEAGVLHRDLKPANIMVTPRGDAKVMDFGLARRFGPASEESATATVSAMPGIVGTLPYMAPEVLLGQEATVRSDLYSFGVTLYEMATGRRPHEEEQAFGLANAILNEEVPPPKSLRPDLSAELEAIVLRCLAREPEGRYSSAARLIADLESPVEAEAVAAAARVRVPRRRSQFAIRLAGGVLAITVLLTLAVALDLGGIRGRLFGMPRIRSIAVLPLANFSGDAGEEYFADGMTEELITTLAQIPDLRVISRGSAMLYKGTKKPLRQIARELAVQAIVEGSVNRSGNEVRISAQLVDARSDRNLWAQSYKRELAQILSVQEEVALAIVGRIKAQISPEVRKQMETSRTVDPAAHEAYLKGRYYFNKYSPEMGKKAAEYFQRAIEIDPGFALAHAGLSDAYAQSSGAFMPATEGMPLARESAQRALALDPDLATAHASLAFVRGFYDWKWKEAEAGFRRAIALNASEPNAHRNLGYLLVVTRRFDEAEKELLLAHQIDPLSPMANFMSLWPLYEGRRYSRAVRAAQAAVREDPGNGIIFLVLAQARFFLGEHAQAIRDLAIGNRLVPHPIFLAWQAIVSNGMGHPDRARALLARVTAMSDTSYVDPYILGTVHASLGDKDRAFQWLEKAIAARSEELAFLQVDPILDSLRSDPRFESLLRRVGFRSE